MQSQQLLLHRWCARALSHLRSEGGETGRALNRRYGRRQSTSRMNWMMNFVSPNLNNLLIN